MLLCLDNTTRYQSLSTIDGTCQPIQVYMYALRYTRNAAVFSWGIGCRLADSCCGRRHRSVPRPRILTRRDEKGLAYASFCTQYRAGIVYIVLLYSCSDRITCIVATSVASIYSSGIFWAQSVNIYIFITHFQKDVSFLYIR